MKILSIRQLLPLLMLLAFGDFLIARADEDESEKLRAAQSLEMSTKRALGYTFTPIDGGDKFALHPGSVLKWTQPVYGSVYGDVFLWTAKGQPMVVSSFVKWYQPYTHVTDEFHSLSTGGIVGDNEGRRCWTSRKPGVERKPIPDAPAPADTPAARLRQIRGLAKDFDGRETDMKRQDRDMRLLTQPLYRYEKPVGNVVVDGALFVLAHGTDPDAFLLIEARRVGDVPIWHFGLARMTTSALRVNYRGKEVWNVPVMSYNVVYRHEEPYTSFRFDGEKAVPPARP